MKAFGIFDGGGVKGAALAGALAATEREGVELVGFGGTSAGSIVALLAAAGYSGEELLPILVRKDFRELLDDDGESLGRLQSKLRTLAEAGWLGKLGQYLGLRRELGALQKDLGLYRGDRLRAFLLEMVQAKLPALSRHTDFSFEDLEAQEGARPLKVVASDLTGGRPAIFSRQQREYGSSVLEAVRASAGYPIVFQPVVKQDRYLVDGGLSSNLPAFLFAEEYRQSRIPALAFDLVTPEAPRTGKYGLAQLVKDMLGTALEASDEAMRDALDGVVHIPIHLSRRIDAMDFALGEEERLDLYYTGYSQVSHFLSGYEPLQIAQLAGRDIKRQLMARFGAPRLYQLVLRSLAAEVEELSGAQQVRACLMLPTARRTLIVVYEIGMGQHADSDLELPEDAGCCGQAFSRGEPVLADLRQVAENPDLLRMTREDFNKIPADRKSMMSVPIHRSSDTSLSPLGVLCIDSSTPLSDTQWVEQQGVDQRIVVRVSDWAAVIRRLLP